MAETPIGQPAGRFPFLLLPLGKSYPLHQRLVLDLRLYKLARKPAKIAQEIQRMIYNSMLVTGCTQPGVPRYSRYECSETEQGQQRDEFPSVQILRVSKVVNAEATTTLYSYNLFTALFFEGNDQLWDVMESFGATSGNFNPTFMSELVDAVGHMFEPDTQKLPGWLFGSKDIQDRTLQDTKNWVNNSSYMRGEYSDNHDYGEGFDFSRFIRQIGPSNAAKIKKVQLIFGDLPQSADHLPLYAEILKQHVAGLEELRIAFNSVNEYDSHEELETREGHTLDAVEGLFAKLRQLSKDLPKLKNITFICCEDTYNEMAHALVKAKHDEDDFDIRTMWTKLRREYERKVNGAGFPCNCRRQCCFAATYKRSMMPYRIFFGVPYIDTWDCEWNKTWHKGI